MPDTQALPGFSPKKWWEKPEGKMALVPVIGIAVLLFLFGGPIGNFIVNAVDNLLHLVVVAIALFVILFLLFDKHFRMFLSYLYLGLMRWLVSAFVSIDPISVLKSYLEKMKDKKDEFQSAMNDLNGQKVSIEQDLKKDTKAYNDCANQYSAAKKQNNQRVADINGKQMARLNEILAQEQQALQKMLTVLVVLTRYRDVCDDTIQDWSNEIAFRDRQQKQSRSINKAMRAAMGILKGLPDDEQARDIALEKLEHEYAQKMGEVEQALDVTKAIVSGADVKDAAAIEQADRLYEDWKSSNGQVQFGGVSKQQLIAGAENQARLTLPLGTPTPVPVQDSDWLKER
jgi:hypothetical protein